MEATIKISTKNLTSSKKDFGFILYIDRYNCAFILIFKDLELKD